MPLIHRRQFLQSTAAGATALALLCDRPTVAADTKLEREVGITTSSLSGHLVAKPGKGQFSLPELPRVMREELDMRVIDLNTSSLASEEPRYLDQCREAAEKAGCVFTNLKLNQRGLDMNSPDVAVREKALVTYERSIEVAARLGCRWARPLPLAELPDMEIHVAGYRRLAEYAAKRNVQMLVENYGWMDGDPDSVPKLLKAIDRNVAACPDTGNWSEQRDSLPGACQGISAGGDLRLQGPAVGAPRRAFAL